MDKKTVQRPIGPDGGMMTRREFVGAAASTAALTVLGCTTRVPAKAPKAERPRNLLVIHTDEQSFRTLGCYRQPLPPEQACVWGEGIAVETPHTDWLASHGAMAARCYATSPVCTPSRASFLTGLYPQHTGALLNEEPLRDGLATFASILADAGYATGYAGKWHLDGKARPGWAPTRKFGFQQNRYMFNIGHWKVLEETPAGPQVKNRHPDGSPSAAVDGADATSYTTDFLTDRAIRFIQDHKDRPFCFMLSIPDPHDPNTVRPPYDVMYNDLNFQHPRSARERSYNPPNWFNYRPNRPFQPYMRGYFGMVKCIDDNVGRLLATLQSEGILEQTVVVFTTDHGDLCGEHGRYDKGLPFEASARIPFLLYAAGLVTPGTVVQAPFGVVDFMPTILRLLNVPSPPCDGRDISRWFTHPSPPSDEQDEVFLRCYHLWAGIVTRQHKFIVTAGEIPCLFDLDADPFEMRNVVFDPALRDTVRILADRLLKYVREHDEPLAGQESFMAALNWALDGTGRFMPANKEATPINLP